MSVENKKVYIVGTFDTKQVELLYVRDLIAAAGVSTTLVDVGIRSDGAHADVTPEHIAKHHPNGESAVFVNDRGDAVQAMSEALQLFIKTRTDVGGMLALGGSGGTGLVTPAMQDLPIGVPKLMVSTLASGDVSQYVGPSDIAMLYSVTDVAGLNRISRRVLANAAHALAGMMTFSLPTIDVSQSAIGLSMFGVTTPCVNAITAKLEKEYDCLVFHATGTGGRSMEKLIDGGDFVGVLDITTTEVCDLLVGGVLSAGEDRMSAVARTGIPFVGSCGALDMVNFWGIESVPEKFQSRTLYKHNAQVTLMRTNVEECKKIGEWIGNKLNACQGPVEFLLPLRGISALDTQDGLFYLPEANKALFEAIEGTVQQTPTRRLHKLDLHINDVEFSDAAVNYFQNIMSKTTTN